MSPNHLKTQGIMASSNLLLHSNIQLMRPSGEKQESRQYFQNCTSHHHCALRADFHSNCAHRLTVHSALGFSSVTFKAYGHQECQSTLQWRVWLKNCSGMAPNELLQPWSCWIARRLKALTKSWTLRPECWCCCGMCLKILPGSAVSN